MSRILALLKINTKNFRSDLVDAITDAEPKVAKFVDQIGTMIGSISVHLATERTLELFAPVSQADYVGWNGGAIGPKGHDDFILSDYEIVDDAFGAANAVPTIDEDGEVCLHAEIEPYEDGLLHGESPWAYRPRSHSFDWGHFTRSRHLPHVI